MSNIPYQPLIQSRREIRLVILEDIDNATSRPNIPDSPLKCEMITTSLDLYKIPLSNYPAHGVNKLRNALARYFLDDQPFSKEFFAVSYVWGNPAAVCETEINGTAARIGESLHAALSSIRNNTRFRILWVDALCINQSDNKEKSWQVQQMAAIYSRARATISWLGPPSQDSNLALETLTELDKKTSRLSWFIREAKEGGRPPSKIKNMALQIAGDSSRWNAIVNMCARPYWTRIWIFQEMACTRDRYFLCGDSVVKDIDRSIALLFAWQVTHEETVGNLLDPQCFSMVDSVQTFRFHGDFPADAPYYIRPGTLHEILGKLNTLNTTEMRDKIYAPLGVATDRDELGIVPDYSKDLDLIFTETACALLRAGYLGVLLSASSQDKTLQLPSWVPDWSTNINGEFGRTFRADKGHSQRSSTLKAIPSLSDHVILDGYVVGKIAWIHNACPTTALGSLSSESDTPLTFADWLKQFEVAMAPTNEQEDSDTRPRSGYNTPESAIEELLCAVGGPRPVWSLLANPYLRAYKALKSANSLRSLLQDSGDDSHPEDPQLMGYIKRVLQILETGSRPYLTDSGAMGLTEKDKDSLNDLVVLIPGASVPCVLRPLGRREMTTSTSSSSLSTSQPSGHYQLVSATYIHGIMDGEFFNNKKNNIYSTRQVQSFTLF
ncbi:hypothetical protein H2198_008081 [Neophaeococcomyces mojaviensis]|uniref:Uncharacterized protein n=1 Tax=Neophaeococcomyces mojaviensis TaxID=3383035 RepID=A0ACC2ZY83_9EURO|nr:hypothetical protein H2198_008081 [Knufia sp. JES_112]